MIPPILIVPSGSPIPRIGEIVALPGELNRKWRLCEGVVHCFDLVDEVEIDGENCRQFTVKVLLSEP